jgi:hypothetical protein
MEMIVFPTKAFDLLHSSFDPVTCSMSMDSTVIDISTSLSCAPDIEEGEGKKERDTNENYNQLNYVRIELSKQ